MRTAMKRLAAGSAVVCLLLAGCGGDDDTPEDQPDAGTTPTTTTVRQPTRAEFISAADTYCKRANAQAKRLNARLVQAQQAATDEQGALRAIAPLLRDGVPFERARLRALRAIEPPPKDEATIERYLDLASRQTRIVERLADAAKDADVKRFAAAGTEQIRLRKRAESIAKSYGFKECGSRRNEAT
jgi:hypothetical protein